MEQVATDFLSVTELAGDDVSKEQVERLCNRYYWSAEYCRDKKTLEVACGTAQGAGFLKSISAKYYSGDFSKKMLLIARSHFQERIEFLQFNALELPCLDNSLECLILFEAIYYLPSAERFVSECLRVLRPGGVILISTANKDLFDFSPSPYSYRYYGTMELVDLLESRGFRVQCFGGTPVGSVSLKQKILRPVKKLIVDLNLMPKSMAGKKFFKRLVFGKLVPMPAEITEDTAPYTPPVPIPTNIPDKKHKVIYCAATLES